MSNVSVLLVLETLTVPDTCLLENGGCDHYCDEGWRGLNCSCADGYSLDVDGRSCVAKGGGGFNGRGSQTCTSIRVCNVCLT